MWERLLYNCCGGELSPVLQSVVRLELFTLRGLMSLFLLLTFNLLPALLLSLTGVEVTRPLVDSERGAERRELGGSWEDGGLAVTPSAWK